MPKKLQLRIPIPCHENWENMTDAEKGRYCSSCQKIVTDFSNMSDSEIALFFKKPSSGSVCGRFLQDQLNRDIDIPRKRIPWIKYFFHFALPAFLVSCGVRMHGRGKFTAESKTMSSEKTKDTLLDFATTVGILMPEIVRQPDTVIFQFKSDKQSKRRSETILPEVKLPTASDISECTVENKELKQLVHIEQSLTGYVGQVVTQLGGVSVTKCSAKKRHWPISFLKERVADTMATHLRIYPNPVRSNSTLHIEWKEKQSGKRLLQLFNQNAQLVFEKDLWIDAEARVLRVDIPLLPSGNYFLRMTNEGKGKSYSERIIIQ